jgi:excisionase family DNA binding protein
MAIIVADYHQLLEDFRAMIRHEMQSAPIATSVQQLVNDELLTIKQAAELLDLSVATVHEHKRTGRLPYTKLGGRAYIKRSDVLAAGTQHQRSAKTTRLKGK